MLRQIDRVHRLDLGDGRDLRQRLLQYALVQLLGTIMPLLVRRQRHVGGNLTRICPFRLVP
ncbi:hypothetical protein [Bradyrhizobium sp. Ec3.3]|uniref:hypothetical protein n=1 Tax=Bradyrhizobium sp. Ec3.3 TaxID=189753 RepID=UPI0004891F62|nr:hypothetical protein [Bradyrhizobium sp. Ec3.3]